MQAPSQASRPQKNNGDGDKVHGFSKPIHFKNASIVTIGKNKIPRDDESPIFKTPYEGLSVPAQTLLDAIWLQRDPKEKSRALHVLANYLQILERTNAFYKNSQNTSKAELTSLFDEKANLLLLLRQKEEIIR